MRRLTASLLLALSLALAGLTPSAKAHPHAWIDLKSTLIFDEDGQIVAVEMYWLFDDFYTAFVLEDIEYATDGKAAALIELAGANLENLAEYGYFADFQADGERVTYGPVETYDSGMEGERLWMSFVVPLSRPVDPREERVTFAVYDPTYYIEILYVAEGEKLRLSPEDTGCTARIQPPNPDPEVVAFAASLGPEESGGDSLGLLFAETVTVECP